MTTFFPALKIFKRKIISVSVIFRLNNTTFSKPVKYQNRKNTRIEIIPKLKLIYINNINLTLWTGTITVKGKSIRILTRSIREVSLHSLLDINETLYVNRFIQWSKIRNTYYSRGDVIT